MSQSRLHTSTFVPAPDARDTTNVTIPLGKPRSEVATHTVAMPEDTVRAKTILDTSTGIATRVERDQLIVDQLGIAKLKSPKRRAEVEAFKEDPVSKARTLELNRIRSKHIGDQYPYLQAVNSSPLHRIVDYKKEVPGNIANKDEQNLKQLDLEIAELRGRQFKVHHVPADVAPSSGLHHLMQQPSYQFRMPEATTLGVPSVVNTSILNTTAPILNTTYAHAPQQETLDLSRIAGSPSKILTRPQEYAPPQAPVQVRNTQMSFNPQNLDHVVRNPFPGIAYERNQFLNWKREQEQAIQKEKDRIAFERSRIGQGGHNKLAQERERLRLDKTAFERQKQQWYIARGANYDNRPYNQNGNIAPLSIHEPQVNVRGQHTTDEAQRVILLMASDPVMNAICTNTTAFQKWKQLGPLTYNQIIGFKQQSKGHMTNKIDMNTDPSLQYRRKTFEDAVYEGQLNMNDLQHGFGRLVTLENIIYEGQWENGKLNGFARVFSNDGTCHIGMMANGEFSGYGIRYPATGLQYTGVWHGNNEYALV